MLVNNWSDDFTLRTLVFPLVTMQQQDHSSHGHFVVLMFTQSMCCWVLCIASSTGSEKWTGCQFSLSGAQDLAKEGGLATILRSQHPHVSYWPESSLFWTTDLCSFCFPFPLSFVVSLLCLFSCFCLLFGLLYSFLLFFLFCLFFLPSLSSSSWFLFFFLSPLFHISLLHPYVFKKKEITSLQWDMDF